MKRASEDNTGLVSLVSVVQLQQHRLKLSKCLQHRDESGLNLRCCRTSNRPTEAELKGCLISAACQSSQVELQRFLAETAMHSGSWSEKLKIEAM